MSSFYYIFKSYVYCHFDIFHSKIWFLVRASTSSSWIIITHLASNHVSIWIFIFLKAFFFSILRKTFAGVAECVFSTSESLKGNINSYNRNEKGDIICKTAQQKLQQYVEYIFLCDCHLWCCENNHCVVKRKTLKWIKVPSRILARVHLSSNIKYNKRSYLQLN